ncbi:cystathionine beta-lyase [Sphingomonas arenae]|uniref:cystathionine beta-lyase n=1 Tax=Sphingomonas arenae TaxID=2812555 RepID=UPI0019684DEC|nr:cystathionine beta-lyase [Sphingomonas arenae]
MTDKDQRPATRLITAGRRKEWLGGMVNVPPARTSTVLFDTVADMHAAYPPRDGTLNYGRNGTAVHWALAEALTALEPGAAGTRLFPSGASAVAMALTSVLEPGDELLMVDSAYGPTRAFCDQELTRRGIVTRYYDPLVTPDALRALIGERTRALYLESPGSLTFEVQDVPGLCAVAKEHGLVALMDNTWATPLFFPAIAAGVDLSIVACTKYISGHSDVMLGSVTASGQCWEALDRTARLYGNAVGPDDVYLGARGLRTLGIRLNQHQANALEVARWLSAHPKVARVLHPALPTCPGHDQWQRDFHGASGLFSFVLRGGTRAERDALIDRLELFGIGFSWGGFESLAVPVNLERMRTARAPSYEGPLVRLQIGLEDPADLIADIDQALAAYP